MQSFKHCMYHGDYICDQIRISEPNQVDCQVLCSTGRSSVSCVQNFENLLSHNGVKAHVGSFHTVYDNLEIHTLVVWCAFGSLRALILSSSCCYLLEHRSVRALVGKKKKKTNKIQFVSSFQKRGIWLQEVLVSLRQPMCLFFLLFISFGYMNEVLIFLSRTWIIITRI